MIGKTILHYKIIEKLGEGGMGVVYLAEDTRLDRNVAIKFLPKHVAANDETRRRFKVEAKAAAALNHPNIATIHAIETSGDETFIVMEYVDGKELKEVIENVGAKHSLQTSVLNQDELARNASPLQHNLSIEDVIDIAIQIANGLQAAHEKGITHRDIKSSNIMLTGKGRVKIMDFGLAKVRGNPDLTKVGSTLGTAAYMSPEQFSGEAVDHRSDIWSFGVLLFNMLTGQMPFEGDYEQALMYSIMNQDPASVTGLRSEVPMEIERIVKKALEKNPAERYQNVDEITADLTAIKMTAATGKPNKSLEKLASAKKKSPYLLGTVAVLLTLLVLFAMYFWSEKSSERGPIDSIAVLPLNNLSGDAKQDYFVDGMTEALTSELSKIEALGVTSRNSMMRYKNTDKSIPEIGRELQIDALVGGSVLLIESRVRITVQLIEAETDRYLWSKSYDREVRDVLSLHQEVARGIAGEIQIKLTPQDEARLSDARPIDPKAFDLYLRGRRIMDGLGDLTGEAQALNYLKESVEIDPNFALAYTHMPETYIFLGFDAIPPEEAELKSRRAAAKALQLNDRLPEAHVAMGMVRQFFDIDWAGAEASFRRAIELNPRSEYAHSEYGHLLQRWGRFEEAIAEFEIFHTLVQDPLSLAQYIGYVMTYYSSRQYDLAIEYCRKALKLDSTAAWYYERLAFAYLQKGDHKQALTCAEKWMSLTESPSYWDIGNLGYIYSVTGMQEKALTMLDDLQMREQRGDQGVECATALVYIGLGEKEKALAWLELSYERLKFLNLFYLKVLPEWDPLRDEPRFKTLLKKLNFEVDK